MSTAAPVIPPRPARVQQAAQAQGIERLPEMPPRPLPKRLERSVSPSNYPRSPLNEPFSPLGRTRSRDPIETEILPKRPSVQHLPSVGQEGMEYGDLQVEPVQPLSSLAADAAAQTRNVAEDLHLHAPKPSLPKASAAARVEAVTRTDSNQAASHGIGKPDTPGHDDHVEPLGRVRSRASFSRPNSSASQQQGRRSSFGVGDEHGPAELGMRVPINPLLGDVQAPSPAPHSPSHTGQNGEKRRQSHFRNKSGRDAMPPGSYGLHGHGVASSDPFEKDWYAKHPEELANEEAHGHGVYEGAGSGRGAFALSSDDLNKIVRDTASRGAGFGTSGNTVSYPDEQIGYMASENYTSKGQPGVPPELTLTKTLTNASQPAAESPLRTASLPTDDIDPVVAKFSKRSISGHSNDSGDENNVHVDSPEQKYNKITGGEETMHETPGSRPYSAQGIDDDGRDYSVPILAADEVAKEVGSEHMQPAISPRYDRRSGSYDDHHRSGDATPTSRPSSRPGSIYGLHSASHSLSRFMSHHDDRDAMHTPLEDVDEYEPLFADEDTRLEKRLSHAERFKPRPDTLKHRFPSQDIWEDAPSSVMYSATVSTPDLPHETPKPSTAFETPQQEAARKGEPSEEEKARLVPNEERLAKSKFAPHLRDDMPTRPGMKPRFPSQDIWEDSPDSQYLVTTVSSPPIEEADEEPSFSPVSKPMVPPRPATKNKLVEGASSAHVPPVVPARPQKKQIYAVPPFGAELTDTINPPSQTSPTELKKVPSIPDRPKPQIPPRPAKKLSGEALSKTISPESTGSNETEKPVPGTSPPLVKAKPQIPARPSQANKFGSLKGNFMSDLNQKLGLGPPKEKEPEPEVEAKPLEDARKGRARGPQRRAPAKSPSAVPAAPSFSISKPRVLFHIDDMNLLNVGSIDELTQAQNIQSLEQEKLLSGAAEDRELQKMESATSVQTATHDTTSLEPKASVEADKRPIDAPEAVAPSLATNTAGEFADPTLGSQILEKPNPLSLQNTAEEAQTSLSQHTTASSDFRSGHVLTREEPDPSTDAIAASKQTTASISTNASHPLERTEVIAPEEQIELRDEQVSAAAPGADESLSNNVNASEASEQQIQQQREEESQGADQPAEPMPEKDISYEQLEKMTRQADGKQPLAEGETRKVVD